MKFHKESDVLWHKVILGIYRLNLKDEMPTTLLGGHILPLKGYCTNFLKAFFVSLVILCVMVQKFVLEKIFCWVINLFMSLKN